MAGICYSTCAIPVTTLPPELPPHVFRTQRARPEQPQRKEVAEASPSSQVFPQHDNLPGSGEKNLMFLLGLAQWGTCESQQLPAVCEVHCRTFQKAEPLQLGHEPAGCVPPQAQHKGRWFFRPQTGGFAFIQAVVQFSADMAGYCRTWLDSDPK